MNEDVGSAGHPRARLPKRFFGHRIERYSVLLQRAQRVDIHLCDQQPGSRHVRPAEEERDCRRSEPGVKRLRGQCEDACAHGRAGDERDGTQ